jgi:murein tripeptide amidase MpaA
MRLPNLALFLLTPLLISFSPPTSGISHRDAPELMSAHTMATARVPAPEEVLGFRPGDDRRLASWSQVIEYFKRLDAASDRVWFEELGRSTMNAPFVMATISAPENLARLNEFKEIQAALADPRRLGANPDRKARQLIARGKTIVLITCGIHSNEVGSYLSSMLIAHRLASSDEPSVLEILRNTIVLLVPSLNPDGVDIVKNWYDQTLGTPYEGTDPPVLYHKYAGHDDNRDWYAFTQVETQIAVDRIHNIWHPQIVHDIHQQGQIAARLFLPPYMQPVEPNVPRQIVAGYTELGEAMAREMRAAGFKGITTGTTYDAWTPARAYSHYHGGVRILSETASARLATPLKIAFSKLRSHEGYNPQKESADFKPLWTGGQWRIRDITNYMTAAAYSLLTHAARHRALWLNGFYEMGKEAMRPRQPGELWGFKVKAQANTSALLDIMKRAGVEMGFLAGEKPIEVTSLNGAKITYPSSTVLIPLAQPYGAFAKAMLERQNYPNLRDKDNHPIAPYDVTAHTLPLLMGVDVQPVTSPFRGHVIKNAEVRVEISDCALTGRKSIALYKSHVPAIDEGWTRWALGACFEYEQITDREIRSRNFEQKYRPSYILKETKYKYIIFPDQRQQAMLEGHRKGTMPDEYTGGIGAEGVKALREFVEAGGTLIFLNRASDFAIEQFKLPVRDITRGLPRTEFYAPGSILRTEIDTTHRIARGMPRESIAWVEESPVFEVEREALGTASVRVIARYPVNTEPLLSGWLLGGERLRGRAALLEVKLGKGRIYLFGFRPQYRGQSLATYPLLFNALAG